MALSRKEGATGQRSKGGTASPLLLDAAPGQRSAARGAAALLELRIKDFAIVNELTLSLDGGLNALTGETGAGKSILIDALGAVLGGRVSPAMIRAGAERALIEATFSLPAELPAGLEIDDQDEVLILSREIGPGRGSSRINGRTLPASMLQAIGRALVDIHGQTDHQSLLRPSSHLLLLDRFGGLDEQRRAVGALVAGLRRVRDEIERLRGDERQMAREQDMLRFQLEEIRSAGVTAGEDDDLAARRSVLANAERLRETVAVALAALDGDGQALDAAGSAAKAVADAVRLDGTLAANSQALQEALDRLREVSRSLARYGDAIEADPDELQSIEDRIDLLRTLKRKYGKTLEEVLAFGQQAEDRLGQLLGADAHVEQLEARAASLLKEALQLAQALSAARLVAAKQLASVVQTELAELNMPSAAFQAVVRQAGEGARALSPSGIDEAEFMLSANPGEPARPLVQVASGGEASRVMLALKSAFSAVDDIPVLVFDEIEAGVGARSGHVVGRKLRQLAERHQVLCITHLAPVAAQAGTHFVIRKVAAGDRTATTVERVTGEARVDELAEMLAGRPVTQASRTSARELLE